MLGDGLNKNSEMEELNRVKYEDFRKEILAFKDLPESTFSDQHTSGSGDKLGTEEAKNLHARGIISRIQTSGFPQKLHFELVNLWEKEILGLTKERTMHDDAGNVIN